MSLSHYLLPKHIHPSPLNYLILVIGRNNLWATLPDWGPTFQVSFDLYINSYSGLGLRFGTWAEMLRFTTTETDCCNVGDRIPAIFTHADGYVHISMIMNGQNWVKDLRLNEKTWYQIDMTQYHAGNVCIIGMYNNGVHLHDIILGFSL